MPDLFRGRFDSPTVGLVCSLMILFFLSFMLIAQFKAGAIVMSLAWPGAAESTMTLAEDAAISLDKQYYIGLTIFTVVVVGYTLFGGFLASVWTDLFQSVLMAIGVMILLALSLKAAGGLENATKQSVVKLDQVAAKAKVELARYESEIAAGNGPKTDAEKKRHDHAKAAANYSGAGFVTGPGMGREFLPLGLACSFFVVWIWGGVSSPASVLRVMASKDTATLRRSIVVLSIYNLFIYLPLIVVCICARSLMPDLSEPDTVVPRMALTMTREIFGGTLISGLILAAPFGAVMATVSCYLVVLSSGLVRDVYQRFINPEATDHKIRRMTYYAMTAVGVVALLANIYPPKFLQALVVFCTSGQTGALFAPIVMACYWRRATKEGVLAAMGAGALVVLVLYGLGFWGYAQEIGPTTAFRPYFLFGLEPIVWAIAVSGLTGIVVSLNTPKPSEELVAKMFDVEPATVR
ncbi:MAG: sodium:solute symporter [Pirellulales bacterium]